MTVIKEAHTLKCEPLLLQSLLHALIKTSLSRRHQSIMSKCE